MKVFNGIIGVLAIFGAIHCFLWDGTSFLNYGWTVTLVLLLWGISAIANYAIERKTITNKNTNDATIAVIGLICGIAACIISIAASGTIIIQKFALLLIFVIFVILLFVFGVRSFIHASKIKKSENKKGWGASLVSGIILVLLGIGGVINLMAMQATGGIAMGIMLGVFGIAMLISIFEKNENSIFDELEV